MINISVYPIDKESLMVQWAIPDKGYAGTYRFTIKLFLGDTLVHDSGSVFDRYYYIIPSLSLLTNKHREQYTVEVTATYPTGLVVSGKVLPTYNLIGKDMLLVREIIRKENLRFRLKVGLPIKVYKRKLWGEACTSCVDKLTGMSTKSHCDVCLGTRIVGGYHTEVDCWAELVEDPAQKGINEVTTQEQQTCNMRIDNTVMLSPRDKIVEVRNNKIWYVVGEPALIRFKSFPITQTTMLIEG